MKFTKINKITQKQLIQVLATYKPVTDIIRAIDEQGGTTLLVGGAVRDLLLGLPIKDLDCEVYNLSIDQLQAVLHKFGVVSLVGKAFGVLRLHGVDVDWSLPRIDASGRKPDVTIDPHMTFDQAFRRRDLTINAMAIDLISMDLIDPFNGVDDLQKKILRCPDPVFFVEDPLRFFRVMQFIARFEMEPNKELNKLCMEMDVENVSVERIQTEFEKMFLRSKQPSRGLRWLDKINRLYDIFPELAATVGVQQNPDYHPEKDVFEHIMQTVDAAAALEYKTNKEKIMIMFGALCHDLGKVVTTEKIDGIWRSIGHEVAGVPLAKSLLKRVTRKNEIIDGVRKLVRYHCAPVAFVDGGAKLPAYKRLAKKLAPEVTLNMLAKLSLADKRARNVQDNVPLVIDVPEIKIFLKTAEQAQVLEAIEQPVLLGRDLLDVVEPGARMGKLLKQAYEIQIEEGVRDKEELKKRVLAADK
jgi:tRNA nucleotidyltransferase (CCA-adding enzyme)